MPSSETVIDHRQRVTRAMAHINQNLDQDILLDQIAAVACYSPFHFLRVFETLMGETPRQYTIRKRMERAGFYLLENDQRIIDTALGVGYETHTAFCKVFKKFYGMSPRRFRDKISRKWFYKANRFYHPVEGVHARLAPGPLPAVQTLPRLNIIYIEDRGFLNGSFPSSAQRSLKLLKKIITDHDLEHCVTVYVGIYPKRLLSMEDNTAIRYKGAVIDRDIESLKDVNSFSFPPGRYAIFEHYGPYEFTIQSWNRFILGWLPRSGRQPRGSNLFEIYLLPPLSPIQAWQLSAYLLLPVH
jgi:AraC family transcriptional regulator